MKEYDDLPRAKKKMKLHIPWNEIKVHELETLYYQVCVSSSKWDDINVFNLILPYFSM